MDKPTQFLYQQIRLIFPGRTEKAIRQDGNSRNKKREFNGSIVNVEIDPLDPDDSFREETTPSRYRDWEIIDDVAFSLLADLWSTKGGVINMIRQKIRITLFRSPTSGRISVYTICQIENDEEVEKAIHRLTDSSIDEATLVEAWGRRYSFQGGAPGLKQQGN